MKFIYVNAVMHSERVLLGGGEGANKTATSWICCRKQRFSVHYSCSMDYQLMMQNRPLSNCLLVTIFSSGQSLNFAVSYKMHMYT